MPYTPNAIRAPASLAPLSSPPPCVVLAFRPAPVRPLPTLHVTVNLSAPVYTLPRPGEDGDTLAGSPSSRAVCMALVGVAVLLVLAMQLAGQA